MKKIPRVPAPTPTLGEPDIQLPSISSLTGNILDQLTSALGVDRSVVALDDQIQEAWSRLPRLLHRIPPDLRDEKIVKACIAIATGLFDSAINYVWNSSLVELRQKVRRFGLHVVPQILDDKSFDEGSLFELKDSELLDLCLKLNLITEQDFFFLDQCRATRNSYSVAHPSDGYVNEDEVINFISRCQRHALSSAINLRGVDTKKLLDTLKHSRFKETQKEEWEQRLRETFDAQRELIFVMLHGIYCDPDSVEEVRVNSLTLCSIFKDEFTPKTQSLLVDRHQEYKAKGDESRHAASQLFFENLGLISLLSELEIHSVVTSASKNLLKVHNGWDNFYNEPPFAERLEQISRDVAVPQSAQAAFVEAVVTCGVGNIHGASNAAMPSYRSMVESFSPREIGIMLTLATKQSVVSSRIKSSNGCARRFKSLISLLDESSVPTAMRSAYDRFSRGQ